MTKNFEETSILCNSWTRWVLVLAGVSFVIMAITMLLHREPIQSINLPSMSSSLEIGATERAEEMRRSSDAPFLERLYRVFGPADPTLLLGDDLTGFWLVGEVEILRSIISDSARLAHPQCQVDWIDVYSEALSRILHVRSWYPQVSAGMLVDRMCCHASAYQALLPPRLLLVVDTAARSFVPISNAVLFYESRRRIVSMKSLQEKMRKLQS